MRKFLRVCFLVLITGCFLLQGFSQQTALTGKITDQYDIAVEDAEIRNSSNNEVLGKTDSSGSFSVTAANVDSIRVSKIGHETISFKATASEEAFILERDFAWSDLLNPLFYIRNGGLWLMLFIVFAETGLMIGFFLPGDSLLFVAGIYSGSLVDTLISGGTGSD